MKKNELVMELSERTDLPKIDTERVLNEFISVVKERLKEIDALKPKLGLRVFSWTVDD